MPVTATIGTTSYPLLNSSLPVIHDSLDQSAPLKLVLLDLAGKTHFQPLQPVSLTDSIAGRLYTGYIDDVEEENLPPNPALTHTLICFDERYLANKRVASDEKDDDNMAGQYAGENVVYLLAKYLADEGVTASYAQRRDSTLTDFQTGTLAGVTATANVGDGDLELATAGSTASQTFATTSDFLTGATLTGIDAGATGQPGNQLNLKAYSAIKFTGTNVGNLGNTYAYWKILADNSTVLAASDSLQYDVWISSTSPLIQAAVDFVCTDGTTLRDFNGQQAVDQNTIKEHPGTDLNGYANDQWYHRRISIPSGMVGKTIAYFTIAFEGDTGGNYQAYFRNIFLYNSVPSVKKTIFDSSQFAYRPGVQSISGNYLVGANGYTNLSVTTVTAYEQIGTWISPAISINAAKLVRQSLISWTTSLPGGATAASLSSGSAAPNVPTGTTLTLYTSIDDKGTWQQATFEQAIPNLMAGFNVSGRNIYVKAVLAITNPSPELSPILTALQTTVSSSWQQTKTDSRTIARQQSDFNAGHYTTTAWYGAPNGANSNLFSSGNVGVALSGYWEGWDRTDGVITGTTTYTSLATTNVYTWYRQLNMYAISGSDIRLKLNNAPSLQNFTAQITVAVREDVSRENGCGIVYRTTNWNNANNTFGYTAMLEFNGDSGSTPPTSPTPPHVNVQLGRGSNSGSTNSYTSLFDVRLPFVPQINTFYTLKVVVSGNTHSVYVDDVLYPGCTATDSTFSGAGGFGIRYYNASGNGYTGIFDNFGVVASTSGTWDNGAGIALGTGLGSVGNSLFAWDADVPSGSALLAQTSVDNGATYQTATNGGPIPNLPVGTDTTNKSVRVKFTFSTNYPSVTPILKGWTIWATKQTLAQGSRIAPALNLSPVGRAGSTLVNWNGSVPPTCALAIDTSLDGKSYTNIGVGAQGGASVAGIQSQLDPIDDSFDANTSSFYTSTFQTNGSVAAWDFSTANPQASFISASGGATAFLLYNSLVADDVDLICDVGTSDAGGLVWRFVDSNNFYDLALGDPQSPRPSSITLSRVANNVRSTLASASLVWTQSKTNAGSLIRGSIPHRVRVTMLGSKITVYFDGVQTLTATDHFPLAAGQCGLRTDTIAQASSATFYHFRALALGDSVTNTFVWTRVRMLSTDPVLTPQLYDLTTSVRSPNIGTGAFIPSTTYSIKNGSQNTIAQAIDDMAKQSNYWSKIGYDPETGRDKEAFFLPHNAKPAPFIITAADMLLPNSPITVKRSSALYRTKPWILGGTDTTQVPPESFKTDGFRQVYTLKYPVESLISISDGQKSYSFGVQGIDVGKDFYYQVGSHDVPQETNESPLAPGLTLTFTYNGQINVVATASNPSQIAAQAALDRTSGLIEVPEVAQGLSQAAAASLAASRQEMYGTVPETISFTTARVGLAKGHLLPVFLPQHGIIDKQYLIHDIVIGWRLDTMRNPTTGQIDATPYFTITATKGALPNGWYSTLSGMGR